VKRLLPFSIAFLLAAIGSGAAQISNSQPVSCIELTAWIVGGISTSRLTQLVSERGIAFIPSPENEKQLRTAGADGPLLKRLHAMHAVNAADGKTCSADLVKAAESARQKHYEEAEKQLRQLLRSEPEDANLHFAMGEILRDQEQWDDALDEFTEAARRMAGFPEVHNRLAYIFYRTGDPDSTIAEARTSLSIDSRNAEAYRYLGLGLYSTGKYEASLHAYQESLVREPENAAVYYDAGIALHDRGDQHGAMVAYRHALRLKPDFWEAHSNLGIVLHDLGRLDEAIAEYKEAKRLAPAESSIRNNLGNTYCDKGDYDAAIAEFRELYKLDASWENGHACMAKALMAKKNYEEAITHLRLAVRMNPTGASEHRVLGQALLLTAQPEAALQELQAAVYLAPDSALGHHYLGTAYFEVQAFSDAEKEFQEALRLEPTAQNHYSLAACLMAMSRNDEALAQLEIASHLDPGQNLYRARKEELMKAMAPKNAP